MVARVLEIDTLQDLCQSARGERSHAETYYSYLNLPLKKVTSIRGRVTSYDSLYPFDHSGFG